MSEVLRAPDRDRTRRASVEAHADHLRGSAAAPPDVIDPADVRDRSRGAPAGGKSTGLHRHRNPAGQRRSRSARSAGSQASPPRTLRDAEPGPNGRSVAPSTSRTMHSAIAPCAVEGDALRIESEMKRLGVDAPRVADNGARARRRRVPEPEPSAPGSPRLQGQARRRDHRCRIDRPDQGNQRVLSRKQPAIKPQVDSTWHGGKARMAMIPRGPTARLPRFARRSIGGSGLMPPPDCSSFRHQKTFPRHSPRPIRPRRPFLKKRRFPRT